MIESTKAQNEQIPTYCDIFVDDIVEGQPVTATIQMSPSTPTGEGYTHLIVYLKSPNGVGPSSQNGPWVYMNIPTDPNGRATVTFDVPTYSGKWYVFVNFGGQTYVTIQCFILEALGKKNLQLIQIQPQHLLAQLIPLQLLYLAPTYQSFP